MSILGKNLKLRAIEKSDLKLIQTWRNDERLRRYFREYRDFSLTQLENWYNNMIINLGTGSQVFYFNKNQSYIPSGRSLLYIHKFFKDVNKNLDIFKDMNKLNLESVLKGSLKINLNFFKQNSI